VVTFGVEALGEVPGVPLLFESVVDDGSDGGLALLELLGPPLEAGSVEGDGLVEPVDGGGDVGVPLLLGVDLPLCPHASFFSGGPAVAPPGALIGGPLGLLAGVAGVGEVTDGSTFFGGPPNTGPGVQVLPSLLGVGQGGFGLTQRVGSVRQADAGDGVSGDGGLGVEEGGEAGLLVGREGLKTLPGEGGSVG
jgi:hypothetical protein